MRPWPWAVSRRLLRLGQRLQRAQGHVINTYQGLGFQKRGCSLLLDLAQRGGLEAPDLTRLVKETGDLGPDGRALAEARRELHAYVWSQLGPSLEKARHSPFLRPNRLRRLSAEEARSFIRAVSQPAAAREEKKVNWQPGFLERLFRREEIMVNLLERSPDLQQLEDYDYPAIRFSS